MKWWEYALFLLPWLTVFVLWLHWWWRLGWWTFLIVLAVQAATLVSVGYYARWRGYS